MLAPTASPASKTTGVSPFRTRCAAAAKPTGPAPITATGRVSGIMTVLSSIGGATTGTVRAGARSAAHHPASRVERELTTVEQRVLQPAPGALDARLHRRERDAGLLRRVLLQRSPEVDGLDGLAVGWSQPGHDREQ